MLRFDRRLLGLGLSVVLVLGSACGTRLEKEAIVGAHDGTGSQSLAAGVSSVGSGEAAVPGVASDTDTATATGTDTGSTALPGDSAGAAPATGGAPSPAAGSAGGSAPAARAGSPAATSGAGRGCDRANGDVVVEDECLEPTVG